MAFIHFNLEFYEETKPITLDVLFVVESGGCVETRKKIGKTIIWKFLNFFSEKLVEAVIMFVKCDCVVCI